MSRPGELIGYARVSTGDQHLDLQVRALEDYGCTRIYRERASGQRADRPELGRALDYLRAGDTMVIWRLDRLGRSLLHLVQTAERLHVAGVELVSITEQLDSTTPVGKLQFAMLASFAEFERSLIQERVRAGIEEARARGRKGGRKPALTREKLRMVEEMLRDGRPQAEIARIVGVSRWTIGRYARATAEIVSYGPIPLPNGSFRQAKEN